MRNMLLTGAILDGYRSLKDKSLKITFSTQEASPELLQQIGVHNQTFGFLAFKKDDFKQSEIDMMEGLKSNYEDTGKSKSQRLKAVLHVNWTQKSEGYKVFDDYYNSKMETLITHFKGKLD